MSKRFLTNIDLTTSELQNAVIQNLASDPSTGNKEGRIYYNTTTDVLRIYANGSWQNVGAAGTITAVNGTTNEIDASTVGGVVTLSLPATVSADISGNAATATYATTAGTANGVAANSVALGTDTTGNYVASVGGTDGVSVSGSGEGASVTIANTDKGSSQNIFKNVAVSGQNTVVADSNNDTLTLAGSGITITTNDTTDTVTFTNAGVTSIAGTTNEVEVSASTGSVTVGLPNSVQITNDLTVGGNLTVNGTTTTLNTTELLVEDNIITLNSTVTGTPTLNAGIEVERGTSANVVIRWNESTDTWELTRDGTNYEEITTVGTVTSGDISDFAEAAQDAVGGILVDGNTVNFTYTDATPSISAEVTLAATSYLATTGGLAVDKSSLETALVTDGFTKKYSASIGNGALTSIAVTHNLGTRDVVVNIYDNTTYDTVEADVVRTDTNTVTVSFATAPASNAYRVVVVG